MVYVHCAWVYEVIILYIQGLNVTFLMWSKFDPHWRQREQQYNQTQETVHGVQTLEPL